MLHGIERQLGEDLAYQRVETHRPEDFSTRQEYQAYLDSAMAAGEEYLRQLEEALKIVKDSMNLLIELAPTDELAEAHRQISAGTSLQKHYDTAQSFIDEHCA